MWVFTSWHRETAGTIPRGLGIMVFWMCRKLPGFALVLCSSRNLFCFCIFQVPTNNPQNPFFPWAGSTRSFLGAGDSVSPQLQQCELGKPLLPVLGLLEACSRSQLHSTVGKDQILPSDFTSVVSWKLRNSKPNQTHRTSPEWRS